MAIETKQLERAFRYNSVSLPDPGPAYSIEQVRDMYSGAYPDITTAAIEGPDEKDGKLVYTFRRAVGTKGADATIEQFRNERNAALLALDMEWARARAREACASTGRPMPNDETLLASLHKARYDCTSLDDQPRLESGAWLRERGLRRMCGLPLLPDGMLERAGGNVS